MEKIKGGVKFISLSVVCLRRWPQVFDFDSNPIKSLAAVAELQ